MTIKGVAQRGTKALLKKFNFPRLSKEELEFLTRDELEYPDGPTVYFEIGKNDLRRSLYTFIKYFNIAGYNIEMKHSNALFAEMKGDGYGRLLIKEGIFRIVSKPTEGARKFEYYGNKKGFVRFTDRYFVSEKNDETYYVPITQHPNLYHFGQWNAPVPDQKRIQSAFIAGSFQNEKYTKIERERRFDVIGRAHVYDFLKKQPYFHQPQTFDSIGATEDSKVCIVDTRNFLVPMDQLRFQLSRFDFFMALPGVSVPFSHNIVEAMSVGTIPVIEKNYAEMFTPSLQDGVNAIVYESLDHLDEQIMASFSFDESKLAQMHQAVDDYYKTYLIPEKVVASMLDESIKSVHMISFSSSAGQIQKH